MNKFSLVLFLLITTSFFVKGQNNIGVHNWEYHKQKLSSIKNEAHTDNQVNIIPLNNFKKKTVSKTIFGYLPYWEYYNAKSYIRYDLLTHIALFSYSINSNGYIINPIGESWPWIDIINEAHQNGTKVIMTVVNFDITQSEMNNILTNPTLTLNFINDAKTIISTYSLDGINIDFEASNISISDRSEKINKFMKALTDSLHGFSSNLEVSFSSPPVNWDNYWDFEGLAKSCDYLFVMGYDFYGSWSDYTGPTAPIVSNVSNYNITNTIDIQYKNITRNNPEKLILGVPYYGPHWIAQGDNEGSGIISFVDSEKFRDAEPNSEIFGLKWSENFKNSWYSYSDGKNYRQIWFDNDSSLALKYNLAKSRNLKGVGIWALGYDGDRSELWNLIDIKFGSGKLPLPSIPKNFSVSTLNNNSLKISFSPSDYAESYEIFSSEDSMEFNLYTEITVNSFIIDSLEFLKPYFFKVRAKNSSGQSLFSKILCGIPSESKILIINGYEKIDSTDSNFDYIKNYVEPLLNLKFGFSSCSNDAVYNGKVNLNDFDIVFWMLLDESTANETFNHLEQQKVKLFLENGGKLFISGSEIGFDLVQNGNGEDVDFYSNYLKSIYIANSPLNQSSTYYSIEPVTGEVFDGLEMIAFDDGNHGTIDVNDPDAIAANSGASNIMQFVNINFASGAAGIAYSGAFGGSNLEGKLIYLSVPFETIYNAQERNNLMLKIMEYFSKPVNVDQLNSNKYTLSMEQNYPNPFNSSTVINYSVPENLAKLSGKMLVTLKVYDILGREVNILINDFQAPGRHQVVFNTSQLDLNLSSGVYVYKLQIGNYYKARKMIILN
ncbi:MAG: T9SS type A sorting domain-containing protein [Ignavibacteriae bacterium]|nr:T9SS type A sorting domain-containing protein [Ignavibacteriota bacterium]